MSKDVTEVVEQALTKAAEEILSLRQRVKELEARCIQHAGEKEKLKAALAALKQQGEPVAFALKHKNGLAFEWEGFIQPTLEKAKEMHRRHLGSPTLVALYLAAPTIPEGLQEARECILRAHTALSNRRGGSHDAPRERADDAQIELELALKNLAAAPKPEEI